MSQTTELERTLAAARRLNVQASIMVAQEMAKLDSATNSNLVIEWIISALRSRSNETFAFVFVDQGRRVLDRWVMPEASRTRTVCYPRLVAKRALAVDATGFWMAHNHPGGMPTPSQQDRELTRRMQTHMEALEITLIDHFIVTNESMVSFREKGYF